MHTDTELDLRDVTSEQRTRIARVILHDLGLELPDPAGLYRRVRRGAEWLPIDEVAGDADQLDQVADLFRGVWPDGAAHLEQLAAVERAGTDPSWLFADGARDGVVSP